MRRYILHGIILLAAILCVGWIFGVPAVLAQVEPGLEFAEQIGLSGQDPRVMVARIIQIALGFLGIIAVALIIYAGYLWMTSKGDEEKVAKAKMILKNAAIGLVIILASFAIATFVLSRLNDALGPGGGSGGEDPGSGGTSVFAVQGTAPADRAVNVPKNAVIRFKFTRDIRRTSVSDKTFEILNAEDGQPIEGEIEVSGSYVQFTPDAPCEAPHEGLSCFDAGAEIEVTAASGNNGILSVNNEILVCSGIYTCRIKFMVGDWLDTEPPQINITNQQICASADNMIEASSIDNYGVSHIYFYVEDELVGSRINNSNPFVGSPFNAALPWNAAGFEEGQMVRLQATAYDLDTNEASAEKTVRLSASHCCNGVQDGNETGIDCGGSCLACAGQACAVDQNIPAQCSDDLCASGLCSTAGSSAKACADAGYGDGTALCCLCQARPRIDWLSPAGGFCSNDPNQYCRPETEVQDCGANAHCDRGTPNGASGNFLTIGGRGFGTEKGTVYFTDNSGQRIEAFLADDPAGNPACTGQAWNDTQIIAIVPKDAALGSITVETAGGGQDGSGDEFGPLINDFRSNSIDRPGVCSIAPTAGKLNDVIQYQGVKLNASEAYYGNLSSRIKSPLSIFNSPIQGTATVPNLVEGLTTTFVDRAGVESNFINFTKDPEPYTGPIISSIEPVSGPVGQYITVRGSGFGHIRGTSNIYFGDENGVAADYDFPEICADGLWTDRQIIIKAPNGLTVNTSYQLTLSVSGFPSVSSGSLRFTLTAGTPDPGICRVIPPIGQANNEVSLYGEYFQARNSSSLVRFHNNQNQTGTAITYWDIDQAASGIRPWRATTTVPQDAQTGPLRIVAGEPVQVSNSVNFAVGMCQQDADCGGGAATCCAAGLPEAGKCKANAFECYGSVATSVFEWRFSTGSEQSCAPDQQQCGTVCCAGGCDPSAPNKCAVCAEGQHECGTGQCCNGHCSDPGNGGPSFCPDPPSCSGYNEIQCHENYFCPNAMQNWCSPKPGSGTPVITGQCGDGACAGKSGCELAGTCAYNAALNRCVRTSLDSCSSRDLKNQQGQVIVSGGQPIGGTCEIHNNNPRWHIPWAQGGPCPSGWGFVPGSNNTRCVDIMQNSLNGSCSVCPTGTSCLGQGTTGFCASPDPICTAGSTCDLSDNQCKKEDTGRCECCCDKGQNDPVTGANPGCCAGLSCGGSCGAGGDFGLCTGCAPGGVPNNSLCNCTGTTGRFCAVTPEFPTGACMDCSAITDPAECSSHAECCVDAKNNNACTSLRPGQPRVEGTLSIDSFGRITNPYIARDTGDQSKDDDAGGNVTAQFCGYFACANTDPANNQCNPNAVINGPYTTFSACETGCPTAAIPCSADMDTCSNPSCPDKTTCDMSSCTCKPETPGPGEECRDQTSGACTQTCGLGHQCLSPNPYGGGELGTDTCRCCCNPNAEVDTCKLLNSALSCVANQGACSGDNRGLCCGCSRDDQCGNVLATGCGQTGSRCCQARPKVETVQPARNATNICRNVSIAATFNQVMDVSTFGNNNIVVIGDYGTSSCPAGLSPVTQGQGQPSGLAGLVRRLADRVWPALGIHTATAVQGNFCYVTGNVTGAGVSLNKTRALFNMTRPLDANRTYYVAVRGDADLATLAPGQIKDYYNSRITNLAKVGMVGAGAGGRDPGIPSIFNNTDFSNSEIWKFTTGADICRLDRVRVSPVFHLFNRPGQTQVLSAEAQSSNGQSIQSIAGVYSWMWSWSSANPDIAAVEQVSGSPASATATAGTQRDAQTLGRASATVTFDNIFNSVGQSRQGSAQLRVFLCENPWPPYSPFISAPWPWADPQTGIEFYYCRDAGGFGIEDDLPALEDDPLTNQANRRICMIGANAGNTCTSDANCTNIAGSCLPEVLKEYFFFRAPSASGAPVISGTIHAAGRRVDLSWRSVAGAARYKVYYGPQPGRYTASAEAPASPGFGATVTRAIENLSNGVYYYFAVTAITAQNQETDFSNELRLRPSDTTPPAVPALQASAGDGSIALFWNSVPEATSYIAYLGVTSGSYLYNTVIREPLPQGNLPETTFSSLNNEATYYVTVRSVDQYGNVSNSAPEIAKKPNEPYLISATAGNSQVTLRWLPFSGAQGYTIDIASGGNIGAVLAPITVGPNETSAVVSGLANGTAYRFKIKAQKTGNQESAWSNERTATPGPIGVQE